MRRRRAPLDMMSASEGIARCEHSKHCYLGTYNATPRCSRAADALVWCVVVWGQHMIANPWLIHSILSAGQHFPRRRHVCRGAVQLGSGGP